MDAFLLPATTYEPPLRQARTWKLNTIMENDVGGREVEEEDDEYSRGRKLDPTGRTADGSCSPVPSLTSSISSYYRTRPRSREFDPLYDVSDSESDLDQTPMFSKANRRQVNTRDSWGSTGSRNRYPSLVIPSPTEWPTIQDFKNNSLVPPTPPPKIPISPAVLSLLTPHAPRASAPPSLDGSLSSDQIANSTAPPTPDLHCAPVQSNWGQFHVVSEYSDYNEDISLPNNGPAIEIQSDDGTQWDHTLSEVDSINDVGAPISAVDRPESPVLGDDTYVDEEDAGVRLPAGALDTLKHLSLEMASEPSSAVVRCGPVEMQEIAPKWTRPAVDETPMSETSAYSFSELSIPSPGDFFSSLGASARHTWCASNSEPTSAIPPSSTTAEHFYNAPWNTNSKHTVERIVEVDDNMTDGPPTAFKRPLSGSPQKDYFGIPKASVDSGNAVQEIEKDKPVKEFDEDYEKEIWQSAETTFDRTSVWLAEQTSYMAALRETNPTNKIESNSEPNLRHNSKHISDDSRDSPLKKSVKFLDIEVAKPACPRTTDPSKADPIFYQAFQVMSNASSPTDSFVHRQTRYDAIQAARASLPKEHVNQLLGNFYTTKASRPAPQRPISMMPGKEDPVEETAEQEVTARVERERQALEQVTTSMWIVEAAKYLCGGHLLNSPAAGVLSQAPLPTPNSEHIRVLDLGGQPKCDWAWHCAREYPNVKTYTATSDLQAAAHNLRGPSNHRLVTVLHLWQLPFPDNHFDAISARSLFAFLHNEKPLGETVDEYDMCLRECLRCLKPGGYLEFFVLDAEIVHPGPGGTALSVEFGFNLKARGYDAAPTKGWLGRVRRAGLTDIKRAWMFLPMGAVAPKEQVTPETPAPHVSMYEEQILQAEAVQGPVGSKADAAHISGLVGGWAWERWMLKLQVEMGKERVLEGVAAAFEEGKSTGAGWRCLSGWARKPC
ncbi:hypothetical protein MMC32_001164 [Xylographa parallela]|nr:hypothetical protein [Xylographa parallela]